MIITYLIIILYFILKNKKIIINNIKSINKKDLLITLKYFIIGFILYIISNFIINKLILNTLPNNEIINRNNFYNNIILYSIILGILTPILEEFIFRLTIKKYIKKDKIFIIISTILFSALHLLSSTKLIEIIYIIPYSIMGYTLSKIYVKTKNICYPILSHILNNIITIIVLLINK